MQKSNIKMKKYKSKFKNEEKRKNQCHKKCNQFSILAVRENYNFAF